ncbi:hypothetical protein NEIG_01720 [Nematocida sp. ERTm5]|nr:hypothetical protein NEIRO02_1156 [Nematocida sp. AWRm79]KAI5183474.1 hypothetical protein NEIRO03_1069 [Nematocida sp. AWRm78]OAG32403.1 hypothetical protein NEIG_01720 [Nematocida sp. ERTm5]
MRPEEPLAVEQKENLIVEAYRAISKLEETIPAYLNDASDIIGSDPQELNILYPPSSKERGCISSGSPKKKAKDSKPEKAREEIEEPEEWDTKEEVVGRFDEHGNFVVDEAAPTADESSNGEDWITVEQKTKKRRQKEKEEQLTYTAVHHPEQKKESAPIKKHVPVEESDVDSDGFKIVHDKKGKKNRKPLK